MQPDQLILAENNQIYGSTLDLLLIRIYKLTHISNLEVTLSDPNSGDFVKRL